ncbi:MAG: flagellar assembly protein FliW [Gemmatimonas sp.]
MLSTNTARAASGTPPVPAAAGAEPPLVVESRFGTIVVAADARITFPQGLLGFSDFHAFGLAPLPEGKHPQFRVLQSLEDASLAFLVAPLSLDSGALAAEDVAEACATLGIAREDLAVLLIVTVRREGASAQVSVNLRAPVFVDSRRRAARQYVLPNARYAIRHPL